EVVGAAESVPSVSSLTVVSRAGATCGCATGECGACAGGDCECGGSCASACGASATTALFGMVGDAFGIVLRSSIGTGNALVRGAVRGACGCERSERDAGSSASGIGAVGAVSAGADESSARSRGLCAAAAAVGESTAVSSDGCAGACSETTCQ